MKMKRRMFILFLIVGLLVLICSAVSADIRSGAIISADTSTNPFFTYYDGDVFIVRSLFQPNMQPVSPPTTQPNKEPVIQLVIEKETDQAKKTKFIVIKENRFEPEEVIVKAGQEVTWINEREKLPAFVLGIREAIQIKSPFFKPGESFSWTFDKTGKYVYVDGVVIGITGRIVVE